MLTTIIWCFGIIVIGIALGKIADKLWGDDIGAAVWIISTIVLLMAYFTLMH